MKLWGLVLAREFSANGGEIRDRDILVTARTIFPPVYNFADVILLVSLCVGKWERAAVFPGGTTCEGVPEFC